MAKHMVNSKHEDPNKMSKGGKMQRKLTPAQKKLPPALQAAILKKMNSK